MSTLGADPDHLNALANSLRSAARTLQHCEHGLHARIHSTSWSGYDAAQFRKRWASEYRLPLQRAHAELTAVAARLRDQALEQQQASAADSAGVGTMSLSLRTDLGSGLSLDTSDGAESQRDTSQDRTSSTAQRFLDDLPLRETSIAGGVTISVGFFRGRFNGQLTLAPQADGTIAVTYADRVTGDVGARAGATAGIAVGDINAPRVNVNGGAVGGDVGLHVMESRTWLMDADDLAGFLVRLAAIEAGGLPMAAVGAASGFASRIERLFGGGLGIAERVNSAVTLPPPSRHDVGVGVNMQSHGSFKVIDHVGVAASTNQRITIGVRSTTSPTGDQQTSVIGQIDGHALAQLTARLGKKAGGPLMSLAGGAVSGTIEIPLDDRGQPKGLELFLQQRVGDSGGEIKEQAIHFQLDEASRTANTARVDAAVEQLQRGNIAGAMKEFGKLDFFPDGVSFAEQTSAIGGKQLRAGTVVGMGGRIGITIDGQQTTVSRER